jgi:hypothetical protein
MPDEPLGIPDEEAAGHHQLGGQRYKALARGEVHPMDPLHGQNQMR